MEYLLLKGTHVVTAAVSYALFVLRGVWMISNSPRLRARWVRIVPHVNDTLLLVTAIWMAVEIQYFPLAHGWLSAKVAGLLVYIGLGMIALRYGRTLRARVAAWIAAQLVFFYIVAVAVTRNPLLIPG